VLKFQFDHICFQAREVSANFGDKVEEERKKEWKRESCRRESTASNSSVLVACSCLLSLINLSVLFYRRLLVNMDITLDI